MTNDRYQNNFIPRTIWILWEQGFESAPLIVKECVKSWQTKNPTWTVQLLDANNIGSFISMEFLQENKSFMPLALKSDFIRLALLKEYGGVWADSTIFCKEPIDNWIEDYARSGFFAFADPGKDRVLASWFLISSRNNPLVTACYNGLSDFWTSNYFPRPNRVRQFLKSGLDEVLRHDVKTARAWFNPFVSKFLKIYPYFLFHYFFEKIVYEDRFDSSSWQNKKYVEAEPAHIVQRLGMSTVACEKVKSLIAENNSPVYKLNWRFNDSDYKEGTLIWYIFHE